MSWGEGAAGIPTLGQHPSPWMWDPQKPWQEQGPEFLGIEEGTQIPGVGQEATELAPPGWAAWWGGQGVRPASAGMVPGHSRRAPHPTARPLSCFGHMRTSLLSHFNFFLAASCSMWDLSSPTKDQTPTLRTGSVES